MARETSDGDGKRKDSRMTTVEHEKGCDTGVHTHLLGVCKRGTLEIDAINRKQFATHNSSWQWGE